MRYPFFSRRVLTGSLAAAGLLVLAGCDGLLPPGPCTTDIRPALEVEVVDAATGASATHGAWLIARDGSFADSVTVNDPAFPVPTLSLAPERPGTYDVTVRKAGYATWTRNDVRVRDGECHVRTVELLAHLQPAP